MNKKRNIYIALTLVCLLAIILIQALFPSLPQKELKLFIDKAKLAQNPNTAFLIILLLMYFAFLFIGFVSLILFVVRNLRKKIIPDPPARIRPILSEEKASKLLFLIIFFVFSIYILEALILLLKCETDLKSLSLILNLALEAGVIFIILRFISFKALNFDLKKKCFSSTVKAYLIMLPVILGLLFLNYSILEKMGIKFSLSPVIQLFLTLKNNFFITILSLQIVLLAPMAEELFFRGFLYNLLRQKYGFMAAAIAASAIFAMLHRTPQDITGLFILSMALCYIYERTQNIASPIIFHILHNSLSLSFLFAIKTLL